MEGKPTSQVVYRDSPKEVVVKHKGREIARYRSAEELVEVHMKGMMAIDKKNANHIQTIYKAKTVHY